MTTPVFSPLAVGDLQDIAAYYADKSARTAITLLEELQAGLAPIASYPLAGTPRPELDVEGAHIRSHVVRGYVIYS